MPATKPAPLRLDRFLCFSVYAANHAFGRVYKPLLDRLGLTYPQYLVMVALWEREGRTVGEIGAVLGLESNTLTPLLKRLEAAGLIVRTRSRSDERQVQIRLTSAGRALERDAATVPPRVAAACGLPLEELDRLREQIDRLRSALATGPREDAGAIA